MFKYKEIVPVEYTKIKRVVSTGYKKFGDRLIPTSCEAIEEYVPVKHKVIEKASIKEI